MIMKSNEKILKDLQNENSLLKLELKALKSESVKPEYVSQIYENTTIGLYQTSLSGEIIYANQALVKMLGFDNLGELQKRNLEKFKLFVESRQKFKKKIQEHGKIIGNETIWYKKDESEIFVKESAKAIKNDSGETEYYVGTVEDITIQKQKEKELEESEYKYRILVDAMPEGIVIHKDGKIVFLNNFVVKYYNAVNKDDLIGKPIFNFIRGDYHALVKSRIFKVLKENIIAEPVEQIFIGQDGREISVEVTTIPFPFYGDNAIMSIIRDTTERTELIQELRKANAKAEESNKLKSAFLSNLSHEIKTPMNGILGFAELLKDDDVTKEERLEYIDIINKSGKQLIAILNDIVEISKIEAGIIGVNPVKFNLKELLDNIYTILKVSVPKEKNLKFIYENKYNDDIELVTDKVKLQQIISNLVENAIKFTNEGVIELGFNKSDNSSIEFFVKDTGIGIAKKYHNIIFQRFRMVDNVSSIQNRGSGLGLSITKAYVELLGGSIRVKSEVNKGSTFYFTIPVTFDDSI